MNFHLVALLVLYILSGCLTHNILVFLPLPIWSHYVQVEPIFHELAQRGHNVTVLSPYPPKNGASNLKHVLLVSNKWKELIADWNPVNHALNTPHPIAMIPSWKMVADSLVSEVLTSSTFQDLLHGNNKFDLIFTELFFGQEAFVVLGHIFSAPVVSYSSFGHSSQILRTMGAANTFSYLAAKESAYFGPMSLGQRLDSTLTHIATLIYNEWWYFPQHDDLLSQLIPGTHPRISDMLTNISLVFLTANFAVDGAKLYPPNVVEISGIYNKEPVPLDKELQTIMDNAKGGVIYFSCGSIINGSQFRKTDIHTFLSVFKQLEQTVLWKTDLNASDWEIPKNVYTKTWFNQTSILAHPNCILFLTHGGVSSTMESIRHAVPMIGMPFYGDQFSNLAAAEYYGYGLRLLYTNLTQTSLSWAIKTVIGNPRFQENVSRASKIFTDKPMSSLDTAIYWIEYVIRHQGAHHLKPLAACIPWYQLLLIDVIAIFSTTFVLILYFSTKLVLFVYRKFGRKSSALKDKTS